MSHLYECKFLLTLPQKLPLARRASAVGSQSLKFRKWLPEWRLFKNAPASIFSGIGINDSFPKRQVTAHGDCGRSRYDYCPCKRQILIFFFFLLLNHLEQEPIPAICWGRQVMLMWARRRHPVSLPQIRLQLLRFARRSNSKSENIKNRLCLSQWRNAGARETNIKSLLWEDTDVDTEWLSDCWSGGGEKEVQWHQSGCDRCAFWPGSSTILNRS